MSLLLIEQILQLFIILGIGFFIVKKGVLKSTDSRVMSILLLYVVAPCAIINAFSVNYTSETLKGLLLAVLAAIIVHIVFIPLTALLKTVFHLSDIEKASLIYSNSGNLIIPLVGSILGPEWVIYTSGYMMVQNILMWTHGKSLIQGEFDFNFKKIFLSINILSIFVGLILFITQIQLPSIILSSVSKLGSMMGPLAMIIIGMLMGDVTLKSFKIYKKAYLITFMRLLVYPIIIVILFHLTGLTRVLDNSYQIIMITILACSAPVAATITQFASLYNKQPLYSSMINVVSVICSIITMPLIIWLYEFLYTLLT